MKIQQLSASEAVASLNSSMQGLSSAEALRRLQEYGPNRVEEVRRESLLLRFVKEFVHFFALILWLAAALTFLAEWIDPGQGMAKIGYAVVAVIVVSGIFSFWQEFRVERTLAALRELLPQQVEILREGKTARLLADQLVPGDVIVLEEGNNIAADCRLIEAFGVRVNNATVTGESLSKNRTAEPSAKEELIHAENILLGRHRDGVGRSQGGRVRYRHAYRVRQNRSPNADRAGDSLTIAGTDRTSESSNRDSRDCDWPGFLCDQPDDRGPFWEGFIFAIGIIVAMVPEGLLPTLTLALVLATQRMAKRNVLIRYLPSVETLGSTTVICTDKTGTLTQNRMTVRR